MKKQRFALTAILLIAGVLPLVCQDPGSTEDRSRRLIENLDVWSLEVEKMERMAEQLQSLNSQFAEFNYMKQEFEHQVLNGENVWLGLYEEYQANIHNSWFAYTERMKLFVAQLEEIMSRSQIHVFYNFLMDELWHEGFVTKENTIVKEVPLEANKSERKADTTGFIREYGRDTFEKMLMEYDKEPDFPTKEDLLMEEADQSAKVRELEAIRAEDKHMSDGEMPPWKQMERPSASPSSIGYFFEEQNLPVLQYFHLTLFPQMTEVLRNSY